jgi:hypothetical protein
MAATKAVRFISRSFRFGQWPDSWILSRRAQEFSGIEVFCD